MFSGTGEAVQKETVNEDETGDVAYTMYIKTGFEKEERIGVFLHFLINKEIGYIYDGTGTTDRGQYVMDHGVDIVLSSKVQNISIWMQANSETSDRHKNGFLLKRIQFVGNRTWYNFDCNCLLENNKMKILSNSTVYSDPKRDG